MRILCSISLALLVLAAAAVAAPTQLQRINDVLKVWTPSKQVYYKGETGMSPAAMEDLEQWLRQNAPHWTVIVGDSAKGEKFVTGDGRTLHDFEAMEYALGQGLKNQTGFGTLKDPRTDLLNGVALTILTKDRKITFSPSDEQNSFGFGKSQWKGQLDQKAIEALRNGMNIRAAVEASVKTIEGGITYSLQNKEKARQERISATKAKVTSVQNDLARLEQLTTTLKTAHPEMTGELANPSIPEYQARLSDLIIRAAENPSDVERKAESLGRDVRDDIQLAQDYGAAAARLRSLETEIQALQKGKYASAADFNEVTDLYSEAANAYALGKPDYGRQIEIASRSVTEARASMSRARQAQVTQTYLTVSGAVMFVLLLVILNLARRGDKLKALRLLKEWRALLGSKTDSLLTLLSEARLSVGSILDAEERFAGVTLAKAKETIRAIDELFILSSHLTEIVDRADRIAHPNSPMALVNTFSRGPYRKVIGILTTSKVAFDPKTPIKKLVTNKGDVDGLLGRIEDYQPFEISLNNLIDVFNDKASQVTANLAEISSAWPEADALSTRIQALLPKLNEYPVLPSLKGKLVPELDTSSADVAYLAIKDAIAALPQLNELSRVAEQAEQLGNLTLIANEESQRIERAGETMSSAGIKPAWIRYLQEQLYARADAAVVRCKSMDIGAEIAELKEARTDWILRVEESIHLTSRILDLEHNLKTHRDGLATEQQKLAAALISAGFKANAEDLYRAPETSLSTTYDQAFEQIQTARGTLANGNTEASGSALEAARGLLQESDNATAHSLKYTLEFGFRFEQLTSQRAKLQQEAKEAVTCLAGLTSQYEDSALVIGNGTTIADNNREIAEFDEHAGGSLAGAQKAMQTGRPLLADRELNAAVKSLELAKHYISEIYLRKEELEAMRKENQRAAAVILEDRTKLAARRDEFATREVNRKAASALIPSIEASESWITQVPQNPVEVSSWLSVLTAEISKVKTDFKNDADLLEYARSEMGAAMNQLHSAQTLGSSKLDSPVAPSEKLRKAQADVRQVGGELETLQHQMKIPHSDWDTIGKAAAELTSKLSQSIAEIRGELAAAARALTTLRRAQATVRHAAGWTGRRGVRVQGTPGNAQLSTSEQMLSSGRYALAEANAEQSVRIAQLAIAAAEALVRKLDREAEEEEAARRTSWSDSHSSSSSDSSWGSSSSSDSSWGSSSSSDSGSSSSSFSSDSGSSSSDF